MSIDKLLTAAAAAVSAYYTSTTPNGLREAKRAVAAAMDAGVIPAQIASVAHVRQLYVVQFIDGAPEVRAALRAARWDAERHVQEVIDTMRVEARREFGLEVPKSTIADGLGISRATLDRWLAGE